MAVAEIPAVASYGAAVHYRHIGPQQRGVAHTAGTEAKAHGRLLIYFYGFLQGVAAAVVVGDNQRDRIDAGGSIAVRRVLIRAVVQHSRGGVAEVPLPGYDSPATILPRQVTERYCHIPASGGCHGEVSNRTTCHRHRGAPAIAAAHRVANL